MSWQEVEMAAAEKESYGELAGRLLRTLPLEARLRDLTPEQVHGILPRLLELHPIALRSLSDEYIDTLLGPTREAIRERLAGLDLEREVAKLEPEQILKSMSAGRLLGMMPPEEVLHAVPAEKLVELLTLEQILKSVPAEKIVDLLPRDQIMKLVDAHQLITSLTPEALMDAMPAEMLFASIPPERRILWLPEAALRSLPDEYLATLSEPTRAAIRQRIGR